MGFSHKKRSNLFFDREREEGKRIESKVSLSILGFGLNLNIKLNINMRQCKPLLRSIDGA